MEKSENADSPKSPARRRFLRGIGTAGAAAIATAATGIDWLRPREAVGSQGHIGANSGSGGVVGLSNDRRAAVSRRNQAFQIRMQAAQSERSREIPPHPNNGDEALYPNRIGSYSKGLPHNDLGEVDPAAYNTFLGALASGVPADFEQIPLGCADPSMQRRLVNPQAAYSYLLEGCDSHTIAMPPAPAFAGAETAAEVASCTGCRSAATSPSSNTGRTL